MIGQSMRKCEVKWTHILNDQLRLLLYGSPLGQCLENAISPSNKLVVLAGGGLEGEMIKLKMSHTEVDLIFQLPVCLNSRLPLV